MGEDNSSLDCLWQKKVHEAQVAVTNEWISSVKPRHTLQYNTMDDTNFGTVDAQPFPEIKIENEGVAYPHNEEGHSSLCSDDLLCEGGTPRSASPNGTGKRQRRRRPGFGPKRETAEERAVRLAKMSAYAAERLASETPVQRALRLRRMSDYAAKRLAQETSEQRAIRLARMSEYAAKRLARETPEQRNLRLSRMSAYAAKKQAIKKYLKERETPE